MSRLFDFVLSQSSSQERRSLETLRVLTFGYHYWDRACGIKFLRESLAVGRERLEPEKELVFQEEISRTSDNVVDFLAGKIGAND